ncbi:hypothetical protein [Ramlibacter tataouinensis]|uniref:Uncharacterized protein n=1 Tax=Ramlibacter tataouinensis TaxID=94132 RepID=A0A127K016_9BURK|nr:hypothetical protein [Ramlibacter tataouinensis]AMO25529.1 hypothetical protein UC35_16965 [Ramlibacter tataouinensis]
MKQLLVPSLLAVAFGAAFAKLPAPDDATKAKAAETTARAAWQAKMDGYQLCKSQDKVVAVYQKNAGKNGGKPAPTPVAAQPAASGATPAAAPPSPCTDPGPFAYTPPEQKPLEASGAHSPPPTAASPPSVKAESAQMAPAQKK